MTFAPSDIAQLRALEQRLKSYDDLEPSFADHGLIVRAVAPNGCCQDSPRLADTIVCRPRPDDGGRSWFFTSWGKPITESDRLVDAAVYIHGSLTRGG